VQGQTVALANSAATGILSINAAGLALLEGTEVVLQVGNSVVQVLPNGNIILSDQNFNNISMTNAGITLINQRGCQLTLSQLTGNVTVSDNNNNRLNMNAFGTSLTTGGPNGAQASFGTGFIIENDSGNVSLQAAGDLLTISAGANAGEGIQLVNLVEINGTPYNPTPNPVMRTPFTQLIVPNTTGNAVVTHNLLAAEDEGAYFNVSCAGNTPTTYSVRFTIDDFPVGGTFYIKNTSATFPNVIDVVNPDGSIAVGANPHLAPPGLVGGVRLNSSLCVVEWDGTNLIVN